ncbi:flagellar protein [Aliidiomarina iranensis]|uniref:Flagellar protein n=1 Tax=Aliidiomarina iranensis TaxID=1434071 RepID=A0A432W1X0_9GAMM|nr:flagellar protein FlaG [Aliidiomarina iranensis]RUO23211.1 flagellar protein [Aliidiomarina iranensis]
MTTPISELSGNWAAAFAASEKQRSDKVMQHLPAEKGENAGNKQLSAEELVPPLQQINEVLNPYGVQFEISDGQPVVVQIVDTKSGDVIRQIPSEEVLRAAEQLADLRGMLVNSEA